MAKAKANKKMGAMVQLPECPICLETLSAPIYQCLTGHSFCNPCIKSLIPPICPLCRQNMTQIRNWQLENYIATATVNCPNQTSGCNFKTGSDQLENHLKECIFRVMTCPLSILGRCSWSGALKEMLDHFKNFHPQNMLMNLNQELTINNISVTKDDRFVYIVPQGKLIYILTIRIDIIQQTAYWVVQLIGCKKFAQQHVYEINIRSLQENTRKVTFYEHCLSDAMATAEIFSQVKCFAMPLSFLSKFINERMLSFNLNVRRYPPAFKKEPNTGPQQSNPYFNNRAKYRGKSPSPLNRGPNNWTLSNNQNV